MSTPGSGSSWTSGVRRPPEARKRFNAWSVAFVSYLIQMAVFLGVMFVVLLVGLLLAPFLGLAGIGDGASEDGVLAVLIVVTLAVRGCSLVVQAGYIRRRGGAQPLIACAAAFVLVVLVGVPVRLAGLSTLPTIVLGAILEITVVALLIKPGAQTSTYGLSR